MQAMPQGTPPVEPRKPAFSIDFTAARWPRRSATAWQRVALAAIALVSAGLELYRLTAAGRSNPYYAAAVRSITQSWHNFFFVSFDPAGFVTIDKPPLGFWLQAAVVKVAGYHPLAVLLPQAVATVLSVLLLYALVRRAFGPGAGLLAALALALMPISVVTGRANIIDGTLALCLLAASWLLIRALETGRLGWLLASAAMVGLGFNIKMLEATWWCRRSRWCTWWARHEVGRNSPRPAGTGGHRAGRRLVRLDCGRGCRAGLAAAVRRLQWR